MNGFKAMRYLIIRFILGFASGLAVSAAFNLFPYWYTRHAVDGDGYQVAGFPFSFHKAGGYAYSNSFRPDLLMLDIAIGLVVSFAIGIAAVLLLRRSSQHASGFPVILPHASDAEM